MLLPGRRVLRHCIRGNPIRRARCSDHRSDCEFAAPHENAIYIYVGVACLFETRIKLLRELLVLLRRAWRWSGLWYRLDGTKE